MSVTDVDLDLHLLKRLTLGSAIFVKTAFKQEKNRKAVTASTRCRKLYGNKKKIYPKQVA